MNKIVKKITIRLTGLLIMAAIMGLVANRSFNIHSHRLLNGKIISHAHPFNKSQDSAPFKQHSHSSLELFILEQLETLFGGILFLLLILKPAIRAPFSLLKAKKLLRYITGLPLTRPPPIV
jgi:hypothetical protein